MPTNLYGPNDNFDLETSHALAALLRKAHEAKTRNEKKLVVWGTGEPRREFLHVDDLAAACLLLLEKYDSPEIINIGCGEDVTIRELAELICDVVGFDGELVWDKTKPDGTPRKLLDVTRIRALGWQPTIPLRKGIAQTYEWFLANWRKVNDFHGNDDLCSRRFQTDVDAIIRCRRLSSVDPRKLSELTALGDQ